MRPTAPRFSSAPRVDVRFISPEFPLAPGVRCVSTTRLGGVSRGRYASWNLGLHVGDDASDVARNREILSERIGLSSEPRWLEQVHGARVVDAAVAGTPCADASHSSEPGAVCVVMTADCLPVAFASRDGRQVAVAHAGWRGLVSGVLEETIARFRAAPAELCAWLGPAIGPDAFEVGEEVRDAFVAGDAGAAACFVPSSDRWRADLWALARRRLARAGVVSIRGGGRCTFGDPERFFSYRRDGETGRLATLVWIDPAK